MDEPRDTNDAQPIDPLRQCRMDIDRVDGVLVALLHERARLAIEAGRMKLASGHALVAPAREVAVLARVRAMAGAPLEADRLVRIFQAIIDETREAESEWLAGTMDGGAGHDVQ